ncbi:hypothetical protein PNOK_0010900 [Pyrrhoderma noxium]|uniref:Uncharacterized protein n=1 Tax=Pyrrhoderma noxium TaxID=2282107 RepID=A0A286UU66_9AGAM|nr:hypothetical protein PNOK_0010900 [Pyrrhoderma noxium]
MYPRILQVSGRSIEISQVIERTYEYLSQYISDGDDILGISTRVTFYVSLYYGWIPKLEMIALIFIIGI